jgi:hypothetical protein
LVAEPVDLGGAVSPDSALMIAAKASAPADFAPTSRE